MRRIAFTTLLLLLPLLAVAASSVPVVNSGTINYVTNQITLTGTAFEPAKTGPTVLFNGASLTVNSFSNTQIVATLPAGTLAGTFNLTVTNSAGNSSVFDLTYGATGPQGPAGPTGPTGVQGPTGLTGATGVTGPQGPKGLTGAPGAPGPTGANGIGFIFLNAYDPFGTYAINNVVTYNGSSYVAIVPNGPNPTGPTPDKNPSWSLMASVGATGPAGPQGSLGPIGDPGPQGLTGPAGATGPQGPRGLTGAPGAPGPAGANGIGFTFLSAFDPFATYAANNVVTYNGSTYVAILPNGPNPTGPTPDKNPSWSLMAAAGASGLPGPAGAMGLTGPMGPAGPAGATGPAGPPGAAGPSGPQGQMGEQGTQGLMGNPGPTGPQGPQGPAGTGGAGGVLSYAAGNFDVSQSGGEITVFPVSGVAPVVSATLQNAGTYVIGGQVEIINTDAQNTVVTECAVLESSATQFNAPQFAPFVEGNIGPATQQNILQSGPATLGFLTLNGTWTASSAGDAISIMCQTPNASSPVVGAVLGWLTAIQVK